MLSDDQSRFDRQYQAHLTALKLHDLADSTCDAYARAVRRVAEPPLIAARSDLRRAVPPALPLPDRVALLEHGTGSISPD